MYAVAVVRSAILCAGCGSTCFVSLQLRGSRTERHLSDEREEGEVRPSDADPEVGDPDHHGRPRPDGLRSDRLRQDGQSTSPTARPRQLGMAGCRGFTRLLEMPSTLR